MRLTIVLSGLLAALAAAPAEAALVYVKNPASNRPVVYVARDDGSQPRRLGVGTSPAISPNARWVAWVSANPVPRVLLRRADRSRPPRRVARASAARELRFSPDSSQLAMVLTGRLAVHDIRERETTDAATRVIRGYSFSPDSSSIVYASAGRDESAAAPSDLYIVELGAGPRQRITRDRKSVNPLWGPDGIVHDRQRVRADGTPSYNLWDIQPDGGSLRRITSLRVTEGLSGLVPVDMSGDGTRLLAALVGQDTGVGFAVNPRTGRTRALRVGFLGFDLSDDGRTVLGHTGGPEPSADHDVVTVPWRGGRPTVLVRHAAFPDWSL
jgi:hypothetical protein